MFLRSKHFILGSSSSSSWSSSCCCCCFFFLSSLPSSSFYLHFLLLPFNCNEALFLYYSTKSHKNFLFSHLLQLNSWPPPLLGAQPPLLVVALLVRFFSHGMGPSLLTHYYMPGSLPLLYLASIMCP